jgi:hypothetical protein
MQSQARTVAEYLAELPPDRRAVVESLRQVVLQNLDAGIAEVMQYGMIGYVIPHSIYPPGYHCTPEQPLPYAAIAAQKNHYGLYMMFLYGNDKEEAWFRERWGRSGKRLDMGRACVRFRSLEQVPLDVVAGAFRRATIKRYVNAVEKALAGRSGKTTRKSTTEVQAKSGRGTKSAKCGGGTGGAVGEPQAVAKRAAGRQRDKGRRPETRAR